MVTVFHEGLRVSRSASAATRPTEKGKWSVSVEGLAEPGKYFAEAKKKKVKVGGKKGVCRKDKSTTVTVSRSVADLG